MLDITIRFRHLQCFLTIAQKHSVGRAAEALSITQPALSKTLRELEGALGVRLFERDKKGMTLTRFGEIFLHHAAASISSLRHGVDSIRLAQSKGGMGVALGALPNVASRLLPTAVEHFKRVAPTTEVSIVAGDNAPLLDMLRHREVDIVVGRLARPEHMIGLIFEPLYTERIAVTTRPGHPLDGKRPLTPTSLAQYPFVLPLRSTIIRHEIDRFLIAQGIEVPANTVETTAVAFSLEYVLKTETIWFVPYGAVARHLADNQLAELAIRDGSLEGPVGLTTRSDGTLSSAASLMAQAIRTVGRTNTNIVDSRLDMAEAEKAIWRELRRSGKQTASRKRPQLKRSKKRNA